MGPVKYKILCIGNQWRGSDDGSLFRAFSRAGHLISIVDNYMFIPSEIRTGVSKLARKLGSPVFTADYNQALLEELDLFEPDLVCIYKGYSVREKTLQEIKKRQVPVICIYPDVSLFDHGRNIPSCIPWYDFVFTTKSFGIEDLKQHFGYTSVALIQHCIDPDIHRPLDPSIYRIEALKCDYSFIGSYSPKKERVLTYLARHLDGYSLKIWGGYWQTAKSAALTNHIQSRRVSGDLYALAINSSKINLGILSEAGGNASSGDQITSRTFHIPGAGGFLLHERTPEFLELFREGIEAEAYSSEAEMVEKANYYLSHEHERMAIAGQGYRKVMTGHTSDTRVESILNLLRQKGILKQ